MIIDLKSESENWQNNRKQSWTQLRSSSYTDAPVEWNCEIMKFLFNVIFFCCYISSISVFLFLRILFSFMSHKVFCLFWSLLVLSECLNRVFVLCSVLFEYSSHPMSSCSVQTDLLLLVSELIWINKHMRWNQTCPHIWPSASVLIKSVRVHNMYCTALLIHFVSYFTLFSTH